MRWKRCRRHMGMLGRTDSPLSVPPECYRLYRCSFRQGTPFDGPNLFKGLQIEMDICDMWKLLEMLERVGARGWERGCKSLPHQVVGQGCLVHSNATSISPAIGFWWRPDEQTIWFPRIAGEKLNCRGNCCAPAITKRISAEDEVQRA